MPYITCPDGKTYSRYDTSPYVCDCIRKERAYYDSLNSVCLQDPKCVAERKLDKQIGIGGVGLIILLIGVMIFFLTTKKD
jgi:hypothetical protein